MRKFNPSRQGKIGVGTLCGAVALWAIDRTIGQTLRSTSQEVGKRLGQLLNERWFGKNDHPQNKKGAVKVYRSSPEASGEQIKGMKEALESTHGKKK